MEAGTGAHHCALQFISMGHDARIIDPSFVAPYRKGGRSTKNDRNDARAICEAAGGPNMQFVPIKSEQQQAILVIHRRRRAIVAECTRAANQIRGFLAEFGIIVPKGANVLRRQWPEVRMTFTDRVPLMAWAELDSLFSHLLDLHQKRLAYDRKIAEMNRQDERVQRLMQIQGVGPVTASAIVATVGCMPPG